MSISKPNQWMPLHIDDFLSRTARISTEDKGAYLMLLMNYWRNQEPLPADDYALANIAGVSIEKWHAISARILPFFIERDGLLHNKRIDAEIAKAVGVSQKRQAAGRKGGRPAKQEESKQEPSEKQLLSVCKPIGTAIVNTRACIGPLSETSHVSAGWEPDFDVESFMQEQEAEWQKHPDVKRIRSEARAMRVRGVS
jgi:uncharacterized protein YdaU (DUF1376 family)